MSAFEEMYDAIEMFDKFVQDRVPDHVSGVVVVSKIALGTSQPGSVSFDIEADFQDNYPEYDTSDVVELAELLRVIYLTTGNYPLGRHEGENWRDKTQPLANCNYGLWEVDFDISSDDLHRTYLVTGPVPFRRMGYYVPVITPPVKDE